MTILNEIQKWSEGLPGWQQHAVAILYEQKELSANDLEHVYALLKAAHGIPDPKNRAYRSLTKEQVAVAQVGASNVQLLTIKDLKGVNALAEGKTLSLSPDGLTVIYGDNGVGKSGYSRVLKQACRARDQSEKIRGNVYLDPVLHERPSAKFDVTVDGAAAELSWSADAAPPSVLSALAVFDSHCARAYVDNHGDFAYSPYGLDILEGLAKVCSHLKERANGELRAGQPKVDAFSGLAQSPTAAGRVALALSSRTKKDDVERLGTLSEPEVQRLEQLSKMLGETDPKKKAAEIRAKALRIHGLAGRAERAANVVSDQNINNLQTLIKKAAIAKAAAEVAAKRFEAAGGLEGTGNEAWVELFRAARAFCATSAVVKAFPELSADASCPLCQNALGAEGSSRLLAFDEFIQGEAASAAAKARKEAVDAFRAIGDAQLDLALDEALEHDLGAHKELIEECSALQVAVLARREATRAAAAPNSGRTWEQVPAFVGNPVERLAAMVEQLRVEAKALEDSLDANERAAMDKELAELKARQRLSELKETALDVIEKFLVCERLIKCVAATATNAISRKSTDLTSNMATQEVADALNAELQALGVYEIKIAMKPSSARAKTTFKLVLENEVGEAPRDVLSEGEQRAIAIASFLAEVKLSKERGGVVFDDPVSSLDHARRERVAKRLAAESVQRQVIVFTHDLFFLSVLMDEAAAKLLTPVALTLNRTPEGYGVADNSLPFAGAGVKARVGALRNKQVDCARLHKNGDLAGYRLHARDFYNDLRMTWERAVEELLFNGVVVRFRKSIQTNRLDRVQVTPDDLAAIGEGMSKCSNYTGHDGAMDANLAIPSPQDMMEDLSALENWRKTASDRLNKREREPLAALARFTDRA